MVKARFQLRQLVVLLLIACALAAAGVYWLRARRAVHHSDLVGYLPTANASVVYIDVYTLRRSGILAMLAGSKAAEEPDYQQFVQATKFDYRQDLDAIAAAFKDGRIYFALHGRFHWANLKDYAILQGGSCHNDFCVIQGSQPNRRISFYPLKSDVVAMAIGPEDFGAYQITDHTHTMAPDQPREPVWAIVPSVVLQGMNILPAAAKSYVPALAGAEQIVFSIGADPAQQLQFGVHVTCKDATAASALLTQLEATTKTLRELLAHQRPKPDASDLSGVLMAGTFRRDERQVYGIWPIPKAFLDAVAAY
ncbi:MAG TPA: hypothetical protein VK686_20690 [Bryobacteraceae bacterium]|nr:hypothetical protein [Bryobacteraceae bacterium]